MPNTNDLEIRISRNVDEQVAGLVERGPALPFVHLRGHLTGFETAAQNCSEQLRHESTHVPHPDTADKKQRREVQKEISRRLEVHLPLLKGAIASMESSHLAWELAGSASALYSPEAKQAASRLFDAVNQVRTAVGEVKGDLDDGEKLSEIRKGAGIGVDMNREQPLDVKDVAGRQLFLFSMPDSHDHTPSAEVARSYREVLENYAVFLDLPLLEVRKEYDALEQALAVPATLNKGEARLRRDLAQLRVEVLASRIVSLVRSGLGSAPADALADKLPKTNFGQKRPEKDRKPPAKEEKGGTSRKTEKQEKPAPKQEKPAPQPKETPTADAPPPAAAPATPPAATPPVETPPVESAEAEKPAAPPPETEVLQKAG